MKDTINSIMIIDDNEFDNFYHQRIINNNNFAKNVILKEHGNDALTFIKKYQNKIPDIILLDINMPILNGWEFLAEYNKLQDNLKSKLIIIMKFTDEEINLEIIDNLKSSGIIIEFRSKPITKEIFEEILFSYF